MTPSQAAALAQQIFDYYTPRVAPAAFAGIAHQYQDNIAAAVQATQPTGPIVIAGHSFGGWSILLAASQLAAAGRRIKSIILWDPVCSEGDQWSVPQQPRPAPVCDQVICFPRGATEAPYSFALCGPGNFFNDQIPIPHDGSAAAPATRVERDSIAAVAQALIGGPMFPQQPTESPPLLVNITIQDRLGVRWSITAQQPFQPAP